MTDQHGAITNVSDFRDIEVNLSEYLVEVPHHLAEALVSAVNGRFPAQECLHRRMPLDIGIDLLHDCRDIAAVRASANRRTISTFSCDIAQAVSREMGRGTPSRRRSSET